jgi:hypothetical protein
MSGATTKPIAQEALYSARNFEEQYGIVAVFEDHYGNRWDLAELK